MVSIAIVFDRRRIVYLAVRFFCLTYLFVEINGDFMYVYVSLQNSTKFNGNGNNKLGHFFTFFRVSRSNFPYFEEYRENRTK